MKIEDLVAHAPGQLTLIRAVNAAVAEAALPPELSAHALFAVLARQISNVEDATERAQLTFGLEASLKLAVEIYLAVPKPRAN